MSSTDQSKSSDQVATVATLDCDERRLVIKSIKAVMGFGDLDAEKKFKELKAEQTAQIIELEKKGDRASVVKILYA